MEQVRPLSYTFFTIDTLSIARDLTAAGFDKPQAEALAGQFAARQEQAVTKDFVRSEIRALEVLLILREIGSGIALAALSVTVLGLWIG